MLSLKISILPVNSDFIAIIKVRIINRVYIKKLILKSYFVTKILAISCCHCIKKMKINKYKLNHDVIKVNLFHQFQCNFRLAIVNYLYIQNFSFLGYFNTILDLA